MTIKLVLSLALLGLTPIQGEALRNRVQQFWDLLVAQDKAAALEFVLPENRNGFISRHDAGIKDWAPTKIEMEDEDTARVSVLMHRTITGLKGIHPTRLTEVWKRVDGIWYVQIKGVEQITTEMIQNTFGTPKPALSGNVDVLTKRARIHFVNARQVGMVSVVNGTESPVKLARIDLDETRFRVVASPDEIASGERVRITFEYIGNEIEKNLTSQISLTFDVGDKPVVREVPVLYNYISKGVQSLFGLNDEQVASLTREDIQKIKPVNAPKGASVNPPESPPKPPPGF